MESIRQKKIAREFQRILARLLQREMEGALGCMITVSQVKITPDLQTVRVYITVFPDGQIENVVARLNKDKHTIRHLVATEARNLIKQTPVFEFFEDDTPRVARHIDELFEKIKQEDEARALANPPADEEEATDDATDETTDDAK